MDAAAQALDVSAAAPIRSLAMHLWGMLWFCCCCCFHLMWHLLAVRVVRVVRVVLLLPSCSQHRGAHATSLDPNIAICVLMSSPSLLSIHGLLLLLPLLLPLPSFLLLLLLPLLLLLLLLVPQLLLLLLLPLQLLLQLML
jgi:hypothetical protein